MQCNAVVVETRRKEEHKKVWLSFLLNSTKSRAYGNSALRLLYTNISLKLGRTKVARGTQQTSARVRLLRVEIENETSYGNF